MIWIIAAILLFIPGITIGLIRSFKEKDFFNLFLGIMISIVLYGFFSVTNLIVVTATCHNKAISTDHFEVIDEQNYFLEPLKNNKYIYLDAQSGEYIFYYFNKKNLPVQKTSSIEENVNIKFVDSEPARVIITTWTQSSWYWKHCLPDRFYTYDIYIPSAENIGFPFEK